MLRGVLIKKWHNLPPLKHRHGLGGGEVVFVSSRIQILAINVSNTGISLNLMPSTRVVDVSGSTSLQTLTLYVQQGSPLPRLAFRGCTALRQLFIIADHYFDFSALATLENTKSEVFELATKSVKEEELVPFIVLLVASLQSGTGQHIEQIDLRGS